MDIFGTLGSSYNIFDNLLDPLQQIFGIRRSGVTPVSSLFIGVIVSQVDVDAAALGAYDGRSRSVTRAWINARDFLCE